MSNPYDFSILVLYMLVKSDMKLKRGSEITKQPQNGFMLSVRPKISFIFYIFGCLKIEVRNNLFYPSPDKEVFKFLKFLFVEKFNEIVKF